MTDSAVLPREEAQARNGALARVLADAPKLVAASLQFGLGVLLVWGWQLETRMFVRVIALACVGFPIHHLLPLRFRMPFFVALSLGSIALVLGPLNAMWLVGLGCGFLLLAHVPVPFWVRVGLLFAYGGLLGVFRVELLPSQIPGAIWPILGSMFMFRLIIYMYDLKNKGAPFDLWRGMAYFFMLPNACFTLLPVIDYKSLVSNHYPKGKDAFDVYQTGAVLLLRGAIHLVLYRVVYQYILNDPTEIKDAAGAALYFVATFALYLRISGYFHLILGILHMYGFNLPETHHLYFLASSFTNFWRRINIYWKDFMQKIFFYPVHFRLSKQMGPMAAISIATVFAFLWTWFLHAYQWFWIRGTFPLTLQDALFWGSLGVLVLANLIWEIKFPKKRSLKRPKRTVLGEVKRGLATIGTFLTILLVWNVWSASEFDELLVLLKKLGSPGLKDLAWIIGGLLLLAGASAIWGDNLRGEGGSLRLGSKKGQKSKVPGHWNSVTRVMGSGILLFAVAAFPAMFESMPQAKAVVERLKSRHLNERDRKIYMRGYYEDLTDVSRFNAELQGLYDKKPANWDDNTLIEERKGEWPSYRLKANGDIMYKNAPLVTNEWGMHDTQVTKAKPADTYRIVLVGASHSQGEGVALKQGFPYLLEQKLNEQAKALGKHVEILNMGVGGYGPAAKLVTAERGMEEFNADAMMWIVMDDYDWAPTETPNLIEWPEHDSEPAIKQVVALAAAHGVTPKSSAGEVEMLLKPYVGKIMQFYYDRMKQLSDQKGIDVYMSYIPSPEYKQEDRPQIAVQMAAAKAAGLTVLNATSAYDDAGELSELWIADWDTHPNPGAHERIANTVADRIREPLARAIQEMK